MIVKDPNDMSWHIVKDEEFGKTNDFFYDRKSQRIPCLMPIEE